MSIDDALSGKKAKVLVVEDNTSLQRLYARLFNKYDTAILGDGAEAIKELEKGSFDAIVSDVGLPGKNGWEFYQAAIAKDPSYKDKFIFCFSPEPTPVYDKVLGSGVPYVMKGDTNMNQALLRSIDHILNGKKA